jgi:hypothetical protein
MSHQDDEIHFRGPTPARTAEKARRAGVWVEDAAGGGFTVKPLRGTHQVTFKALDAVEVHLDELIAAKEAETKGARPFTTPLTAEEEASLETVARRLGISKHEAVKRALHAFLGVHRDPPAV